MVFMNVLFLAANRLHPSSPGTLRNYIYERITASVTGPLGISFPRIQAMALW
jgi:hypothetical protein